MFKGAFFVLIVLILSGTTGTCKDIAYAIGENGASTRENASLSIYDAPKFLTFTTANAPGETGANMPCSRTEGQIKEEINKKVNLDNDTIQNEGLYLAAGSPGNLNISQVCSIYDYLATKWSYVGEKRGCDVYRYASDSLIFGKLNGKHGAGDCDDFAILMSALIESIGGTSRIVLAYGPMGGHAYPEVYLGNMSIDEKNIERIYKWLQDKYHKDINCHINDTTNEVWLNLDWGRNPIVPAYPGGPFYSAVDHIPIYILDITNKTRLNPANEPPVAIIAYSPRIKELNAGETIVFNASQSTDPDGVGDIKGYGWSFSDDNSTDIREVVRHTLTKSGNLTVNLAVEDSVGNKGFNSTTIQVNALPVASFTYLPPEPKVGDTIEFNASQSRDPDGSIVNYEWKIGNSEFKGSDQENIAKFFSKSGNITVNLTVTDNKGAKNTTTHKIKVNDPPTALFVYKLERSSARIPNPGEPITFNASQSKDSDGQIVNYSWDFDDGSIANGVLVTHNYSKGGNYTIRLVVKDNNNATTKQSLPIRVNKNPVAIIKYAPDNPKVNRAMTFDASKSYDLDGEIVKWDWKFGDGNLGEDQFVDHAYLRKGNFSAKLIVTDDQGASNSTSRKVVVEENNQTTVNQTPLMSTVSPQIKITTPASGEVVPLLANVNGTISNDLPKNNYLWLAVSSQESRNEIPGKWWPQGRDHIHPSEGKWSGKALIGREVGKRGEEDLGKKFYIGVILVDKTINQQFLDYFEKGNATGNWDSIDLPENASIMAEVMVFRESNLSPTSTSTYPENVSLYPAQPRNVTLPSSTVPTPTNPFEATFSSRTPRLLTAQEKLDLGITEPPLTAGGHWPGSG